MIYKGYGVLLHFSNSLKGIDFNLFKGENVAVLGKSGSGKSVLIKIIVGLLKPDAAEEVLDSVGLKDKMKQV